MKLSQYIECQLKKFNNYGVDNPQQEIRYILQEHLGIKLRRPDF